MISKKTVFILGAGASCHLGYPLGNDLWKRIAEHLSPIKDFRNISKEEGKTEKIRKKNRELLNKAGFSEADITNFYNNLDQYTPLTLDEFIENHESKQYRELAKFAVAQVLIPHEDDAILIRQQGWYQNLFAKMKTTVDEFHKNNIAFVSFNYDRSLEQYLYSKLKLSQDKAQESEVAEAIGKIKFIHIYGKLGDLSWQSREGRAYKKNYNLGELCNAADGIKTVHEQSEILKTLSDVFKNAKRILFLGFGFDNYNLDKLNLLPYVDEAELITGTAIGLDPDRKREVKSYFRQERCEIILKDMRILDFLQDVNLS